MLSALAGIGILAAVALAGTLVARLCRIPSPAFLGPMLAAGILNFHGLYPDAAPMDLPSFLSKVVIGVSLGRRFDRGVISALRDVPVPALVTSLWMIGASILAGLLMHFWVNVPLDTALIGTAAGGIAEMAIFALAMNANVVTVTFTQIFRLVLALFLAPLMIRGLLRFENNIIARRGKKASGGNSLPVDNATLPGPAADSTILPSANEAAPSDDGTPSGLINYARAMPQGPFTKTLYAIMALVATAFGALAEIAGVPAGAMIGGMLGTALVVLLSGRDCVLSSRLNTVALMCMGVVMAESMNHDTVMALQGLVLPLLVPTLLLLFLSMLLSVVLLRITAWSPITCLLATVPAGLSQIIGLAEDYKADVLRVAMLHLVRLVSIIIVFPWIIRIIVGGW